MKKILVVLALALAILGGSGVAGHAQQLRAMTRTTSTTGLNDSALTLISDSASRTRAASIVQLKKALAAGTAFDSLHVKTRVIFDSATAGVGVDGAIAVTSANGLALRGKTGSLYDFVVLLAGSSTPLLANPTGKSVMITAGRIGVGNDGTNIWPGVYFTSDTTVGIGANGVGVFAIQTSGFRTLSVSGGAAATLTGNAGNMTVVPGTGVSRTLIVQPTNSGSTPTTAATFTATGTSLLGTTTNDNAAAGNVGEYVSGSRATGSSLSLSTATTLTVDSISVTAGDWDVSGSVAYTAGATTSITNLQGGISTTTNVLGALGTNFDWETAANVVTATNDAVWTTPVVRVSTASTIFVYLVAQGTFTVSTLKGYGAMRARRVR